MPQPNAAKLAPPKKGSGKPKAGGGKDKAALELKEYNEAKQINKDIIACELEAVINNHLYETDLHALKDSSFWLMGWR